MLTGEERRIVDNLNNFSFQLLRATNTGSNQVLSPLSVAFALAMVNNGAAGETREEMVRVMGLKGFELGQVNALLGKLLKEMPRLDEKTRVKMANNVYVNKQFQLKESFQDTVSSRYGVTPLSLDFGSQKTVGVINQWCSEQTEGMIPKIVESIGDDCVSILLNAIYFESKWKYPFEKRDTKREPFEGADSVDMMKKTFKHVVDYCENDVCQMIGLPYSNNSYSLVAMLPRKGLALDEILDDVIKRPDFYSYRFDGWDELEVWLPTMNMETEVKLNNPLTDMGMSRAFDKREAEFPEFVYTRPLENIYIGDVLQKAKIELDEEGTKAAAVTKLGMRNLMAAPPKRDKVVKRFIADRPFLYFIMENSTGAILFIGKFTGKQPPKKTDRTLQRLK